MAGPIFALLPDLPSSSQDKIAEHDEKVQNLLHELHSIICDTQKERESGMQNLDNISKSHEKVQAEQKLTTYYKHKLRNLYTTALNDAEKECDSLKMGLEIITKIKNLQEERRMAMRLSGAHSQDDHPRKTMRRGVLMSMLQKSAQTLPLWIGKPGEKYGWFGPLIYIHHVAEWISFHQVVSFNQTTNKYEVDDIDEEGKERHTLSRRRVVPLPQWRANPDTDAEAIYPKGTLVMALYPQTTCFYRAVIHSQPKTSQDEYHVLFEDSSYADGYSPALPVAQKYVVVPKEMRDSRKR